MKSDRGAREDAKLAPRGYGELATGIPKPHGEGRRSRDALDARGKRRDRAGGGGAARGRETSPRGVKGGEARLTTGETCHFLGFSNKSARRGVRTARL